MDQLKRDLVFAFRSLAASPLLTGAALLSLALGIGANTTIFTLINAVFLRGPAHIANVDSLVTVWFREEGRESTAFGTQSPFSRLNFLSLEERSSDVFDGVANQLFVGAAMRIGNGEPEPIGGIMVSGNYFEVLGVRMEQGRAFLPQEDAVPGSGPVVVLSHNFWQQRFGSDPKTVGSTLMLNSQSFEVIGIAPEGFNGTNTLGNPDFWAPMAMHNSLLNGEFRRWFDERRPGQTFAFARLRAGTSFEQANQAVELLGNALAEEFPVDNKNRTFLLRGFRESMIGPAQRELFVRGGWMLMGAVGLVLLIACGNVANLLLAKAAARRKEIAIRLSIGATRGQIIRQLITEALLLALTAGALGLLLAHWFRAILWSLRPPFLEQSPIDLSFDIRVLGFTLLLAVLTGLIFGLVPAIRATRTEIVNDLKDAQREGSGRRFGLREALVLTQVALSFVALIGAGLFVRSLGAAGEVDLGFEPEGLVSLSLDVGANGYEPPQGEAFFDRVLELANTVPGVESAVLSTTVPMIAGDFLRSVFLEDAAADDERNGKFTGVSTMNDEFFKTLGIVLVSGRSFDDRDHKEATPVVVINEAMAKQTWGEEDPVGKRFHFFGQEEIVREVIGVVQTIRAFTIGEEPFAVAYLPRKQNYKNQMSLVAKVSGDPEAALAVLRKEIQAIDPTLPITNEQTVEAAVSESLWAARMSAGLLGLLGLLALVLAAIGLYGVMSHAVSQRSRELGIRMALGADTRNLLGMVLGRGMFLAVAGLAIGCVLALFASRSLVTLLYGVSPSDLKTYVITASVLFLVALIANLVPARRATRIDPVKVLRAER